MQTTLSANPYAKVIANSKRVRWDIDHDVIRGRRFDFAKAFLPSGLSLVNELGFLTPDDQRLLSQVQGRSYAYLFGLVERFIGAKVIEVGRQHALGDQVAMEALVRMADEELKHQELFRRLETLMADDMPTATSRRPTQRRGDGRAEQEHVVGACTHAGHRALHAGPLSRQHRAAERPVCLWKDVFRAHWKEEVQHAALDELEFSARTRASTQPNATRPWVT